MIVDTHVHVWEMPPVAPIGPTAPRFTSLPEEAAPVELLIEDMDANGVDAAVLVQTSWSTWDNTYVARAAERYPRRLRSIGLIDPLDVRSVKLAREWIDVFGMRGFRFHPDYYPDEEILTSPRTAALLREIEDRGRHRQGAQPRAQRAPARRRRAPLSGHHVDHRSPDVSAAADGRRRLARLPAGPEAGGAGERLPDDLRRARPIGRGFPFRDMHEVIKRAIGAFGIDRCLWGTGFPGHLRLAYGWPSLADELRLVREGLDWLTATERASILGENARRLFDYG